MRVAHFLRIDSRSTNPLIEVDHLAPIIPGIDVADRAAFRATKVRADIAPVPIRQIGKLQRRVVPAHGAALIGTDTIHDDVDETRVTIDGAGPVAEPSCGLLSTHFNAIVSGWILDSRLYQTKLDLACVWID
jgi:hypothetical protein